MPKIIGQEEQQRALKEISASLKELTVINSFLSAFNPSGKYTVYFVDENGSRHSCTMYSETKDDVDLLALNHKARVKSRILFLANEYRIALDPSEQYILDHDHIPEESDLEPAGEGDTSTEV